MPLLALLIAASYLCMRLLGPAGLPPLVLLWLAALPTVLAPARAVLRREWAGAAFLFLVASYAETIDGVFDLGQRVSVLGLGLGLLYLWQRREDAAAVLRSPLVLLVGAFLLQQVLSALALNPGGAGAVLANRGAMFLTLLAAACLVRRPGGRALGAALVVLGVLLSVPVALREVADAEQTGLSSSLPGTAGRAGGLYYQANLAAAAFRYGLAFAFALLLEGALGARTLLVIAAALGAGVLTTASRGGLVTFVLVLLLGWLLALRRRTGRGAELLLGGALAAVMVVVAVSLVGTSTVRAYAQPLGEAAARGLGRLEAVGVEDASRLEDLVLAATGSPDRMAGEDSGRSGLAAQALQMIGERPVFGWGTGALVVDNDLRSHVQFLDVLGENGAVGGLLYAALLLSLLLTAARLPAEVRHGCYVVCATWFISHFITHSLMEFRYLILPLAWAGGLDSARTARANPPLHP